MDAAAMRAVLRNNGLAAAPGSPSPYCVEVNTLEFRSLTVAEASRRAADTATSALRAAGVLD